MKRNYYSFLAAASLLMFSASAAQAANLYVIGDATLYGWDTEQATALVSTPETPDLYTGTLYLQANADFKFMTTYDFGGVEVGAAEGATLTEGLISLASGSDDSGYGKIQVPEEGNYYMAVNLATMEAEIVKSEYQDSQITLCSLFMVGDATENGWSVDEATPLYQEKETPYVYSTTTALNVGTFKIATVIKGAGTWQNKYWYYKDINDDTKMVLGQDGDEQWSIAEANTYKVVANTLDNTISISVPSGITSLNAEDQPAVYYSLEGMKIENPSKGIFICKKGDKVQKVILK